MIFLLLSLQYVYRVDINIPNDKAKPETTSPKQKDEEPHVSITNSEEEHSKSKKSKPNQQRKVGGVHTGLRTKKIVVYDHCDIIGDQFWLDNPEILGCNDDDVKQSVSVSGDDKERTSNKPESVVFDNMDGIKEMLFPKHRLYQPDSDVMPICGVNTASDSTGEVNDSSTCNAGNMSEIEVRTT